MTRRFMKSASLLTAALTLGLCGAASAVVTATNVTTFHYDNLRTGWDNTETVLTPTAVHTGSGGPTNKTTTFVGLDEQVEAQPLNRTAQHITGHGTHNTVNVATENNTIYAIDADTGKVILQNNFGAPVPIEALPGGCSNNSDVVGINGTPVIDATNGVMFVITYNYVDSVQKFFLHKISLETLKDVAPKVRIQASGMLTNGHTYNFKPSVSRQRAGMLLQNGNVYAGFASFCDVAADQSRGWVLGWNASTMAPFASNELTNKLATSTDNFFLSSIWMSGYGLASNGDSVYFVTGNSDYSGDSINSVNNIAESAVQMPMDLSSTTSVFTPDNASDLEHGDADFGSGGLMLLPEQPGQASNLAVAAGKDGNMYFLNADNLNNNTTGANRILGTYGIGGCWCGASYFTAGNGAGRIVTSGNRNVGLWVVKGKGAHPTLTNEYFSSDIGGDQAPGFMTAVSSNGSNSPVIWAVGHPNGSDNNSVSLYALNAPDGSILFSGVAGYWPNTDGNANIAPIIANGKVFVASFEGLAIYGLSNLPARDTHAARQPAAAPHRADTRPA